MYLKYPHKTKKYWGAITQSDSTILDFQATDFSIIFWNK